MTSDLFFEAVFWFFAIAGIFSILYDIASYFIHVSYKSGEVCTVVTVKSHRENTEALIRDIVWQNLHARQSTHPAEIVVVNLCTDAETEDTLRKLADDYPFRRITDKDGYIDFIRNLK